MTARRLFPALLLTLAACNGARSPESVDADDGYRVNEPTDELEQVAPEEVAKEQREEGERDNRQAEHKSLPDMDRPVVTEPTETPVMAPRPEMDPAPAVPAMADLGGGRTGGDAYDYDVAGEIYEDDFESDDMSFNMGSVEVVSDSRRSKPTKAKKDQKGRGDVAAISTPERSADKNTEGIIATGTTTSGPTVVGGIDTVAPDDRNEAYVQYGINDMTMVDKDGFSTFSIDVDTASYSISRRKLNEGRLPQIAAVRVEEFVNAMPYDYEAPTAGSNDDAPFAVHMEAAPNPWQYNHHIVRIGVQGAEIDPADRPPVHLTFLVDVSGSMSSDDKLGLAKKSLHYMVNNLGEEDTVAIATYAGSTQVILEPTSALNKDAIHSGIDRLSSGGGTNMDSGMQLAYDMAGKSYLPGAENRVIVLSDGDANIGRTGYDDILNTIEHHAEQGITMTTIGLGMGNYKDSMMEQLANKGDGNYFYIDTFDEAQKVFGENLSGTMLTIAKDVKIQVEWNPEAVMGYRLIGYENRDIADVDFRNDRVDAGEIGSGHSVTALYDVILKEDAKSQELATVRLRAKKPGPDSPAKEWATVFDGELLHSEFASATNDFRMAFATATFAELLRGSPYTAEINYSDVYTIAKAAQRRFDEDVELLGLIQVAGELSGERGNAVAWR
jgi:Ca-activated chloride channel homolog